LWQAQGKHDAARTLLADIYSGLTEGFDTTDLQAAKTLLETLEGAVPSARLLFGRYGSA
jgi:adenylate cyclase